MIERKNQLILRNARLDQSMEFAYSGTQIVKRSPGWLHHQVSGQRNLQGSFAGSGRAIDDQHVITIGDSEGLLRSSKQFDRYDRLDIGIQSHPVPVNGRTLLGIQISDLNLQATLSRFATEGTGQRRLPHSAFLRDKSNN